MTRVIVAFLTAAVLFASCSSDPSGNNPPDSPSCVFPEHGVRWSGSMIHLIWDCSDKDGHDLSYDVYLGTDTILGSECLVSMDQAASVYSAEGLLENTTYCWKIIAKDGIDETESPVWEFSTPIQWPHGGTFTDADGNVYDTIIVYNMDSSAEYEIITGNLRATHSPTGEPLEYGVDYVYYDHNPANRDLYGCMYSADVATSSFYYGGEAFTPEWHTMMDIEWMDLEENFGLLPSDVVTWGFRGTRIGTVFSGSLDLWEPGPLTEDSHYFNFSSLDFRPGGTYAMGDAFGIGYATQYWSPFSGESGDGRHVIRRIESSNGGVCRDSTSSAEEFRYIRLIQSL